MEIDLHWLFILLGEGIQRAADSGEPVFVRMCFLKKTGLTIRVTKLPVRTRNIGIWGNVQRVFFIGYDLLRAGSFRWRALSWFSKSDTIESD
jgi:hypothetical protein